MVLVPLLHLGLLVVPELQLILAFLVDLELLLRLDLLAVPELQLILAFLVDLELPLRLVDLEIL
ncbi:hypothetical protein KV679_16190 [Bacillus sp. JRC01]|nr:hypothetical protein [Bacillus sp. JRC01]